MTRKKMLAWLAVGLSAAAVAVFTVPAFAKRTNEYVKDPAPVWEDESEVAEEQVENVIFVFGDAGAPDANDPNDYMLTGQTRDLTHKSLYYVTLDTTPQTVETAESCPGCCVGTLTKTLVTEEKPYQEDLETVCCHLDYNTDLACAYERVYHAICTACKETAYTEEAPDLLRMRICGGISYDEDGWIYTATGPIGKRASYWEEKARAEE